MQKMAFGKLDCGLLTCSENDFIPSGILIHLITFLMKKHVAVMHHRLEQMKWMKYSYKELHSAFKIQTALKISFSTSLHH
jgi:hypothetical protein